MTNIRPNPPYGFVTASLTHFLSKDKEIINQRIKIA